MEQVITGDGNTGQGRPAYWKRRKIKLNILLLMACGSLLATKQPTSFPPAGSNNVVITRCPITGNILSVNIVTNVAQTPPSVNRNQSGGDPSNPTRGGPSEPSRVVFQSDLPFNGGTPVSFTNQPETLVQTVMLSTRG
jgi:hypothetical protein